MAKECCKTYMADNFARFQHGKNYKYLPELHHPPQNILLMASSLVSKNIKVNKNVSYKDLHKENTYGGIIL